MPREESKWSLCRLSRFLCAPNLASRRNFIFPLLLFKSNAHQYFCKCDAEISGRKRLICLCCCRNRRSRCWCLRRFFSQWLTCRFHFYNPSQIQTTVMQSDRILYLIGESFACQFSFSIFIPVTANADISIILLAILFRHLFGSESTVTKIISSVVSFLPVKLAMRNADIKELHRY